MLDQTKNTIKNLMSGSDLRFMDKEKLMADNPTLLGELDGVSYYEHPLHGDESPVVAVYKDLAALTCWWDIPDEGPDYSGDIARCMQECQELLDLEVKSEMSKQLTITRQSANEYLVGSVHIIRSWRGCDWFIHNSSTGAVWQRLHTGSESLINHGFECLEDAVDCVRERRLTDQAQWDAIKS